MRFRFGVLRSECCFGMGTDRVFLEEATFLRWEVVRGRVYRYSFRVIRVRLVGLVR